jgi:integrase/recombinase XerD
MKQALAFRSKLGSTIARYLKLNLALGKKYKHPIRTLKSLDQYLSRFPRESQDLTSETFYEWCRTLAGLTPRVRRLRMGIIQRFCRYRLRTEPDCFVPDTMFFPRPGQLLAPYIFSDAEVACLLTSASDLQRRPFSPLRPDVIRLAIVLLYTTGLRSGELRRLTVSDFDAQEGLLLVRTSKFYKSRVLPLRSDVVRELQRYLQVRQQHGFPICSSTPLIWNQCRGGRAYSGFGLQCAVSVVLDACNIRTRSGRRPRIHDFRHSFAVNTLIRWYRAGADVTAKLPLLSAYMGHVSVASTYHYLHFVEPLRALASNRFRGSYGGLVVPISRRKEISA